MLKPFQILWKLTEFALQALFVYVLALILVVGLLFYVIADNREKQKVVIKHVEVKENPYIYKKVVEEKKEPECKRPAGCRVLEDGTVEY